MSSQAKIPKGTLIGKTKCGDCAATVEVKMANNGLAYYKCNGALEGKACNCSHYFGPRLGRPVIDAYIASLEANDNEPPATAKPALVEASADPRPAQENKPVEKEVDNDDFL